MQRPDARLGRAPSPDQGCLVFIGWLKPSATSCISDDNISPAHGRPAAHPARPPPQSSRGGSHSNPAEPSKAISSIRSGTFQSLLWPERATNSAPERPALPLPGGRAGQRAACPAPIQLAKHHGSSGTLLSFITLNHPAGCITGLRCSR